jgi:hypothetical protein
MNSNLVSWYLVITYSACVFPRSRDEADFTLIATTQL